MWTSLAVWACRKKKSKGVVVCFFLFFFFAFPFYICMYVYTSSFYFLSLCTRVCSAFIRSNTFAISRERRNLYFEETSWSYICLKCVLLLLRARGLNASGFFSAYVIRRKQTILRRHAKINNTVIIVDSYWNIVYYIFNILLSFSWNDKNVVYLNNKITILIWKFNLRVSYKYKISWRIFIIDWLRLRPLLFHQYIIWKNI